MRITGLASGLDTETMIKDLMNVRRLPMDKILQRKQYMEWQRDDYRAVNRQLFDFRNLVSDTMMRQSTFTQKIVTSTDENKVSVKNINSTVDFSGTISIQAIAERASMKSRGVEEVNGGNVDLSKPIFELDNSYSSETSFTIKAIKQDGTFDTTGYEVKFDPTKDSMQKVLDDINKNSGILAFYDSFSKQISFSAKNSGDIKADASSPNNPAGSEIIINDPNGFVGNFLNVDLSNSTVNGKNGVNAQFIYNGLQTERSSNTFQINGFELNLKGITTTDVSFSSTSNTDKILDSVTKFVDEYNKILSDLNGQIREKSYRDFQPLTKEQRSELEEKDIELWEEKAKSGTLRNDSIISSSLSQMRSIINSEVTTLNGKIRISEIGINQSSNYADKGKLVIDLEKLKKTITDNPNGIYELFNADGATINEKGIGGQLRDSLDSTRKKIIEKAGSDSSLSNSFSLGRTLVGFDSQVKRFEDRLQMVETRYYRQFGAMEAAIQRANQQSTYLMNAFNGGQ